MACFIIAALVVALDQLFKMWIAGRLEIGAYQELIPGVIGLTHVRNSGASFGMLSDMRWLLITIVSICVILLIVLIVAYKDNAWGRIGLSAALGGALGNLIDRVFRDGGRVVDMFNLEFVDFAIFNIADCFITVGGVVFCLGLIFSSRRGKNARLAEKTPSGEGGAARGGTSPSIFGGTAKDLSETKILEEYDIERLLREYNKDDFDDTV